GGAGHGRDVRDRQAGLAKGARGAAGRDELEAGPDEALGEGDEPGLVRHGQERAPGDGQPGLATLDVDRRGPLPRPGRPDRPGEEEGDGPWQEPVLDRLDPLVEGRLVVAGHE